MPRRRKPASPFRSFNSSPEVIQLAVMMYVRFPLSLRNVEDLLFGRGDRYQLRERAMARFRQMKTLQKFASVHASLHNHFASERHLLD
ncbi:MAG: hypothetical protein K2X31_00465 [Sphingopyxis sp.]|nr:hypothetical protein [Sphingopyxis sp.]